MSDPKHLATPDDAATWIADQTGINGAVYVAGCAGEPLALAEAYRRNPDAANGLQFFGVWIPGANKTDWAGLSPTATAQSNFVSTDWTKSFRDGRFGFLPLTYSQAWRWLERRKCEVAVLHVSPTDENGECSFGPSSDFSSVFADRNVKKLGLINSAMPAAAAGPKVRYADLDAVLETETPLSSLATPDINDAFRSIGAHVANLIRPGDTLQFGLGKVQTAVLSALVDHQDLRIHSGMVTDLVLNLMDKGVIPDPPDSITTGIALGSNVLYDRITSDPRVRFADVGYTHNHTVLAGIENFVAINSVMEVDLFGQANAEFLNGRQISGGGGLTDFLRGAAASPGGRPIMALNASARSGSISRIVPRIDAPAVAVSRADAGIVVTEHGVADLREMDIDARAQALIAIAAPDHRNALSAAWRDIRKGLQR